MSVTERGVMSGEKGRDRVLMSLPRGEGNGLTGGRMYAAHLERVDAAQAARDDHRRKDVRKGVGAEDQPDLREGRRGNRDLRVVRRGRCNEPGSPKGGAEGEAPQGHDCRALPNLEKRSGGRGRGRACGGR